MFLLKNLYTKINGLKGSRLYLVIALSFLTFLIIGLTFGYLRKTASNSKKLASDNLDSQQQLVGAVEYTGKVAHVNALFYPNEKISYVLTDNSGKNIILLRAEDERLFIVEGLTVKLTGSVVKTADGKNQVLQVDKVIIINGTN
jgi:hypothetical protein